MSHNAKTFWINEYKAGDEVIDGDGDSWFVEKCKRKGKVVSLWLIAHRMSGDLTVFMQGPIGSRFTATLDRRW